ncbi:hypothetical protein [Stenotrophomonas sp. AS012628]|uniref:hypothetical protein n=1 Tax=Stenotrophomonas sp. AS012628 TaxID=2597656 RepID=UPI00177FD7E7|nr:hypothetical protein [Stenotrophomonas sp. AS012628]
MPHTPDMDTQVSLFLLRSRARTADIQRRSMMNQTLDLEQDLLHQQGAQMWRRCLLREGPRHAEEVIQLWCVFQAKRTAFGELSGDQTVVELKTQSMRADDKLICEIDEWIVGAAFHDMLRSTHFKTASGRYPPLMLQASEQLNQGKQRVTNILNNELSFEGVTDYMNVNYKLEGQATRNRETLVAYAKALWFDQAVYTRAIKAVAAGDVDLLLKYDQAVYAAYEKAVSHPSLADIMVKVFAALCAQTPYSTRLFDTE